MAAQVGKYIHVGCDPSSMRVEATMEFSCDPELRKRDVLLFLEGLYKDALEKSEVSVRFSLADGIASGARAGQYANHANHASALVLSTVKSPRYHAKMTDREWLDLVREYVLKAAEHVGQFRVQLVHWPASIEIHERGEDAAS
jgi:hypothetical protein